MSRTYRKVGEKLYLEIQLGDGGDGSTRVFAQIDQPDGTNIVPEFEIAEQADGYYPEETQVMPDQDSIKVKYYIRRSNGTTPSNRYDPNFLVEEFLKDVTGQIVEDNLDAQVSSVGVTSQDIEGTILSDNTELSGSVEAGDLIGTLENDIILEGEIHECD